MITPVVRFSKKKQKKSFGAKVGTRTQSCNLLVMVLIMWLPVMVISVIWCSHVGHLHLYITNIVSSWAIGHAWPLRSIFSGQKFPSSHFVLMCTYMWSYTWNIVITYKSLYRKSLYSEIPAVYWPATRLWSPEKGIALFETKRYPGLHTGWKAFTINAKKEKTQMYTYMSCK